MTGYELLTPEQKAEVDNLNEKATHSATMRFTPLDSETLVEYEKLMDRLESEYRKELVH